MVRALGVLATVTVVACSPLEAPSGTGGVSVSAGPAGRGHALVMSDYQSTNVALLDCRGHTLSGSFVSSASAAVGLSAPLSGDVVLPSEPQIGDDVALIDRYPASVLTFVELATGRVRDQVDVGTGFRSNPQDLLAIDGALWVTRYENNPAPGQRPFDAGGDVLLLEAVSRTLAGRIDLTEAVADAPGFWPRPGRLVRLEDRAFVLLAAHDATFAKSADSRVAIVDVGSRSLVGVRVLEGLAGCSALGLEPPFDADGAPRSMRRLVVGCSGRFLGTAAPTLEDSGVVALDTRSDELTEVGRWGADALEGRPAGFDLTVDARGRALVAAMGRLADGERGDLPDALVEIPLDGGSTRVVTRTATRPFELGGVRCSTTLDDRLAEPEGMTCPADCFVADGEAGVVRRLSFGDDGYFVAESLVVETAVGLPPRWFGRF